MRKPFILAVDDDLEVINAIARDLKSHFSGTYRVVIAPSGMEALEVTAYLQKRNDLVALFLSDQRMPQMTGVQFLEKARQLFPDARRVLLTAYADTEAAIRAINDVKIDYYLMKPYDPPEEKLVPVLEELLCDWQTTYTPPFEGITLVGDRWSASCFNIRDFLAKQQVPYRWVDVESNPEAERYLRSVEGNQFPLVFFPNGDYLKNPSAHEIALKVGLQTRAKNPFYDVIIIGGGPSGLAASVYASSEGLSTMLIEKEAPGGQAGASAKIENYLGFPSGLSGFELARRSVTQAKRFGTEIVSPMMVEGIEVENNYKHIMLSDGNKASCHALVIATGVEYRKLELPGIEPLIGSGIYYGLSMSEVAYFKDEDVFIVGGGNSAGQAAVYLSQFARSVNILIRNKDLSATMSQYLISRIHAIKNIRLWSQSEVTAIHGRDKLEAISVIDKVNQTQQTLPAAALLIYIGAKPGTDWLNSLLQLDNYGFILTGDKIDTTKSLFWNVKRTPFLLEASVPGIFAVGDVRSTSVKRVASAVGEGAVTVHFIHQYLAHV